MTTDLLAELSALVGGQAMAGADVGPSPWETHQPFRGRLLVTPSSTEQVAAVLAACNRARQSVVPIGGITNLVQGCATAPEDVGLSLARMNAIEEVDPVAQTMTVQSGVTLREAQIAAAERGLYFPVDIGARDNCMLGGNVSTNAGGTKVIRYGMIRDSVLGLEAVLADGTVVSSMNRYIKNNSGFDLKHLFIGTEGTLGVITRIVFRLSVQPASHNVALLAAASFEDVVGVLKRARELLDTGLCGFEVMWNEFYSKATAPAGPQPSPLPVDLPFYVIVEAMGVDVARDGEAFERAMTSLFESALVVDGVVAKSDQERESLWAIRHEVEWLVRDALNFDVSLRIADVGDYVDEITRRIKADLPDAFVAAFGHLGDNNIHVSVLTNSAEPSAADRVQRYIYEALAPFGGAISAEHGIGLEKMPYLPISRTPEEIGLMLSLKRMMDPNNILNPGKVVDIGRS